MEYTFWWFIENYSYAEFCDLTSPEFTPPHLGGSSWVLRLNPFNLENGLASVFLERSDLDRGPASLSLGFEISIMTLNGWTLYSEKVEHTFIKGSEWKSKSSIDMSELYVRKYAEFLPQDTLVVSCKMRTSECGIQNVIQCSARTRIKFEKVSFVHRVENLSALRLREKKTAEIPTHSGTGCVFSGTLQIKDILDIKDVLYVDVEPSDSNYRLRRELFSLLDTSGNIKKCADYDYRFLYDVQVRRSFCRSMSRSFIQKTSKEYLVNDELRLLCEFTFYTGEKESKIDEILHEIPIEVYNHNYPIAIGRKEGETAKKLSVCPRITDSKEVSPIDESSTNVRLSTMKALHSQKYNDAGKPTLYPNALDDFKALYNDQLLTDVVLKTATKSFPAHKNVLCARSSVFRAMLTNDMREKNTDRVDVDDMDNETVQQFLLFLYSDQLEDLQWESALKLYYAGDKYAIEKLKFLCSSFLKDNLSPRNASELLLLADTHSDSDLKKSVEDFIFNHEEEVFGSDEWEKFVKKYSPLAMETMLLKYKRKKKVNEI